MLYIGTSGYSYKDWIGPFYPEGTKSGDMLKYYSKRFSFVELNSTYYHMPGIRLAESISKNTDDDFRVAVKLFQGFTHDRDVDSGQAEKFSYAMQPLAESGKLLCLLAQFPYSFHCNTVNMNYLKKLREMFKNTDINIEFRNREWIRKEVMELLNKEQLGFVCVDEPEIRGLISRVLAFTSHISYLRMHGRNAEKWYANEGSRSYGSSSNTGVTFSSNSSKSSGVSSNGSERYDYEYIEEELKEWIPGIREMIDRSDDTIIAFNNHPRGMAVTNANTLVGMLKSITGPNI